MKKKKIRTKYLNKEGILGATCQLYLNSVNKSPLTSFDDGLNKITKQNMYHFSVVSLYIVHQNVP